MLTISTSDGVVQYIMCRCLLKKCCQVISRSHDFSSYWCAQTAQSRKS